MTLCPLRCVLPSEVTADQFVVLGGLTNPELDSNMNITLDRLRNGESLDTTVRIVLAETPEVIVGWATAEWWRRHDCDVPLVDVFVHPMFRRQRIGSRLRRRARSLLETLPREPRVQLFREVREGRVRSVKI